MSDRPELRCDRCGDPLEDGALKYTVRIALTADFDGHLGLADEAAEGSLGDALDAAAGLSEAELMEGVHQELAFLVCAGCRAALLRDPLGAGFLRHGGGMVQ